MLLDLVVDDQEVALRRMRDGEVAGCICATARPVQGARSRPLGHMRYRVTASPGFAERYFPEGVSTQALARAPAILYGPDDRLQQRYLDSQGFKEPFPHHLCPSSEGVLHMVLAGIGYALIPECQAQTTLERGDLVDLDPGRPLDVPLYWHFGATAASCWTRSPSTCFPPATTGCCHGGVDKRQRLIGATHISSETCATPLKCRYLATFFRDFPMTCEDGASI
ncbi:LysR substrate-binding domain-containing protein [Salinicola tamaricis]|uniref:LysR substrate-binding domain-containing protein n=1 Tax=Salinicola tamaricis TaxID=1771309 RepID=UPI0030F39B49